jgi:hypothetical protein
VACHDQLVVIQLSADLVNPLQQFRVFDLEPTFYAGTV